MYTNDLLWTLIWISSWMMIYFTKVTKFHNYWEQILIGYLKTMMRLSFSRTKLLKMGIHFQTFSLPLLQVKLRSKVVSSCPISGMTTEREPGRARKITESPAVILRMLDMSCRGWYKLTLDIYADKSSVQVRSATQAQNQSISHLPVRPPSWASLPSDPLTYPCAQPLRVVPSVLELNGWSRCCCYPTRSQHSPLRSSERRSCTIYTLTGAHRTLIELQSCPSCPHTLRQFIGPETRDLGIFNFNNRILLTHDLLDEYTSAYT